MVKTPYLAPIANCYAGSWIGSFKRECLNHLFCFSLGHLDHITQTYVHYHNEVRPHQVLGNVTIPQAGQPPPACTGSPAGRIRRQQWLGGLLTHYYRKHSAKMNQEWREVQAVRILTHHLDQISGRGHFANPVRHSVRLKLKPPRQGLGHIEENLRHSLSHTLTSQHISDIEWPGQVNQPRSKIGRAHV